MKTKQQKPDNTFHRSAVLTHALMTLAGILLINIICSIGYALYQQQHQHESANVERVRSLGSVLVRSAEILWANNEMTTLRRLVSETAIEHQLDTCQLIIPNEGVVAAGDPGQISVVQVPTAWAEDQNIQYKEHIQNGYATLHFPVTIPERGTAILEISAAIRNQHGGGLEAQAGPMLIAGAALLLMLIIYHRTRIRLRGVSAVHDALLAVHDGQADIASLQLDPELGLEAKAWNQLLGEKQNRQIRDALDQVKQSIHERTGGAHELTKACDALSIGMVLVDSGQRTIYANGAAAVLLKTTPDSLDSQALTSLLDDERAKEAITEASQKASIPRRVIEIGADQDHRSGVLRLTVRPIQVENGVLALVILEDVTQQRVSAAARDSFLAQATHELRSPLTSIRLYVEKAIEDTEIAPAEVAQSLNVVNDESRRLERVVSEILSVSEIEAGSYHLERDDVRLDQLFEQLQKDHAPQAKEKQINLVFDLPPKLPVLQADRDKISVALHNLVGNAIKYTPKQGSVTISADTNQGHFEVTIVDTGLGIQPDDQEHIFDKFYRAKDRRIASITGSGLGLAISREVIRLHGGDITVESEIDKGSIFTLTLPIPEEETEREHSDTTMRSRQRR